MDGGSWATPAGRPQAPRGRSTSAQTTLRGLRQVRAKRPAAVPTNTGGVREHVAGHAENHAQRFGAGC